MTHPLLDRDSVVCESVSQHMDVQFPEFHNTLHEVFAKRKRTISDICVFPAVNLTGNLQEKWTDTVFV